MQADIISSKLSVIPQYSKIAHNIAKISKLHWSTTIFLLTGGEEFIQAINSRIPALSCLEVISSAFLPNSKINPKVSNTKNRSIATNP